MKSRLPLSGESSTSRSTRIEAPFGLNISENSLDDDGGMNRSTMLTSIEDGGTTGRGDLGVLGVGVASS